MSRDSHDSGNTMELAQGAAAGQPAVARDLALLTKRKVALRRYVLQSVPELGLELGKPRPRAK